MKDLSKPIDILDGVTTDYYDAASPDLMDRWQPLTDWANARLDAQLEPYCKVTAGPILPRIQITDRAGRTFAGLNFAAQNYLSLSSHPRIIAAVKQAANQFGVHSAGSASLMGLTALTAQLEQKIATFLRCREAVVFPTGWGAGYGVIRALVHEDDHIVMDVLAHASLQEGAMAATKNVHRFPHCSTFGAAKRLQRIRKEHPDAGILVISEGLFSMDSDIPDLAALQDLCRTNRATLLVDHAHDLGALGPTGRGTLEMQNVLGSVDIVMGCFSKSFAANGGFVASNHPALKLALRFGSGPHVFSTAMSPLQAAAALTAIDIISSDEGKSRRHKLMANALHLRKGMEAAGFHLLGQPSAIVPTLIGDNPRSRRMTHAMISSGGIVNLVEYPAVARNECRWRLQVMSDHSFDDIDAFVGLAKAAAASVDARP